MLGGSGQRQRASASDGSTWSNFFSKLSKLLPYMWPKKSLSLQLRVLACLLCLAGVRVANVFVPIFSKKIGKWNIANYSDECDFYTCC